MQETRALETLPRLAARELEILHGIVGARWVSTDSFVADCYSRYMGTESTVKGSWQPRPVAVVMPSTTEEVAQIQRFCNTNGYRIKPMSTGMIGLAGAGTTRTILLDLARMNRIIDIDVKNQVAVIEPYVTAVRLQTELWKHGLNVHMISAGANHAILPSVTAGWGYGLSGPALGYQARNMLGLEWVMPTGEILTLGSAGDGAGWFTDSGPGPSIHGILRGFQGTLGGLGTFTKCAVKLYRWDGPTELPCAGASPRYELQEDLPPNMGVFTVCYPSKQAMAEGVYKLGEAEIPYADFRLPNFFTALYSTDNNMEFKPVWESGVFQKLFKYSMTMFVAGRSQAEYDWKMQVMNQILREVGALRMPLQEPPRMLFKMLEGLFKLVSDPMKLSAQLPIVQKMIDSLPVNKEQRRRIASQMYLLLVRNANNLQGSFRPSQGMLTTVGSLDTFDAGIAQNDWVTNKKLDYIKQGLLVDDDGDNGCGGSYENGHMGYLEGIALFTPSVPASAAAVADIVESSIKASIEEGFGIGIYASGPESNYVNGPHCHNFHLWIDKIKAVLDPNHAVDSWTYAGNNDRAAG